MLIVKLYDQPVYVLALNLENNVIEEKRETKIDNSCLKICIYFKYTSNAVVSTDILYWVIPHKLAIADM